MENIKQMSRENRKKAKEIDLKELFIVLKKHIILIALITLIAGVIGFFLNQMVVVPLYQSSSRVIIVASADSRSTLQVIVKDSSILDIVIKQMNLKESSDQLASNITVNSIENSQVVSISVVDTDPYRASQIADTVAEIFKEQAPKIMGGSDITILSKAKVNPIQINPTSKNKLLYGIVGGIVIGIGLSFLLESLEDTIRSKEDIESLLEVPVIGRIQRINRRNLKRRTNKSQQIELELRGESVDFK
jgi:capsular polysaccharide biosynthesis protein